MNPIGNELERLIKGTFYTFGSLVLVKAITVINSVVVARMLKPANLGLLTILDQIEGVVVICAGLGIPLAIVKYTSELLVTDKKDIEKYLSTAFFIITFFSLGFCIIYIMLNRRIAQFYNEPILGRIVIFSAMTTFAYSIWEMGAAVLRGLQKIKLLSILTIVKWLLIVPINILLISMLGLVGAAISLMICSFINGVLMLIFADRNIRGRVPTFSILYFDVRIGRRLVGYGLPAMLSAIMTSFPMWLAISYLSKQTDFASVGFYRVSYSLVSILIFIPMAFAVPMVPLFSELEQKDTSSLEWFFRRSMRLTAVIMMFVTLSLAIFSKYLILLLYGMSYYPAWQLLFLLCAGVYFFALNSIVGHLIAGTGRMWQGFMLNAIWAVVFTLCSFLLIRALGLNGFGLSYLIAYIVHTSVAFVFLHRVFGISASNIRDVILYGAIAYCITYFLLASTWCANIGVFLLSMLFWLVVLAFFYRMLSDEEKAVLFSLFRKRRKGKDYLA